MTDEGSSVTLIFYRINPKWWTEPALNLASAVAQMSNLTHCEVRDACAPRPRAGSPHPNRTNAADQHR